MAYHPTSSPQAVGEGSTLVSTHDIIIIVGANYPNIITSSLPRLHHYTQEILMVYVCVCVCVCVCVRERGGGGGCV